MSRVMDAMEEGCKQGVFPGAVLMASQWGEISIHGAVGVTDFQSRCPVTLETFFDLASLTKPMATALGILTLIQKNQLLLSQTLGELIHASLGTDKAVITLDQLLRHTSGLPAHKPYYMTMMKYPENERRAWLRRAILQEPLEVAPGEREIYSDLGFMLLAWVVETVSGRRMDQWVAETVYEPLGIRDLWFVETGNGGSDRDALVLKICNTLTGLNTKTSKANIASYSMASTEICPWRGRVLTGEVHDDNAWAAGGIEGHAGLFGTAFGVHCLLVEIMKALRGERGVVISPELMVQFASKKNGQCRAAGFDVPAQEGSSSGHYFSKSSLGHLGFTGTSFWLDPISGRIVILLTNRVHPSRENEKIRSFRPVIQDLVMTELDRG